MFVLTRSVNQMLGRSLGAFPRCHSSDKRRLCELLNWQTDPLPVTCLKQKLETRRLQVHF